MSNVQRISVKRGSVVAWLAACFAPLVFAATPPPATVSYGPFEIASELRYSTSGGIFSATGNRATSVASTRFTVKYKGELVRVQNTDYVFATKAREDDEKTTTRFWGIARLIDAPRPTLLVQTTDIWMLTEQDGRLVTQSFNLKDVGSQWLDADQGQPTPTGAIRTGKADIEADSELKRGRWLRLGPTVLDVHTLRQYKVPTSSQAVADVPMSGLTQEFPDALAFSPGQTQFVSYGKAWDSSKVPLGAVYPFPALVVSDIPHGTVYGVKLARNVQHFNDFREINQQWLAHYFRWTRDANGVERLVARLDAKPLPWTGRFKDGDFNTVEYTLEPARPELASALAKFIVERMSAAPVSDYSQAFHGTTYRVAGCTGIIRVSYFSRASFGHDDVGLYATGTTPTERTPADCAPVVRRIGEAFNAALKNGQYQELFFIE